MKTFREYLAESKKTYPFKVRVAGDLPENFEKNFKECLGATNPTIVEKSKTPIQASPIDFPELSNVEVHTDRKSTRLNSSHIPLSRMPSSA